jgi:hypothetical protein
VHNADSSSLFDHLDAALESGSSENRVAMLRQVTDLFLSEADRLHENQISVFDDVLVQLAKLSKSNAQRLLRFWLVREVSARSA